MCVFCLVNSIYPSPLCLSLLQELEQLPGYVQDLVEFRLLLFAANGLPSFSTRVAVSQDNHLLLDPQALPQARASGGPWASLSCYHSV